LKYPEVTENPQSSLINRNHPILTDGESLYILAKRVKVEQNEKQE
jgi:hypothetical protein